MHKPEEWHTWYKWLETKTSTPVVNTHLGQMEDMTAYLPKIYTNNTNGTDATKLSADSRNVTGIIDSAISLTNGNDTPK